MDWSNVKSNVFFQIWTKLALDEEVSEEVNMNLPFIHEQTFHKLLSYLTRTHFSLTLSLSFARAHTHTHIHTHIHTHTHTQTHTLTLTLKLTLTLTYHTLSLFLNNRTHTHKFPSHTQQTHTHTLTIFIGTKKSFVERMEVFCHTPPISTETLNEHEHLSKAFLYLLLLTLVLTFFNW